MKIGDKLTGRITGDAVLWSLYWSQKTEVWVWIIFSREIRTQVLLRISMMALKIGEEVQVQVVEIWTNIQVSKSFYSDFGRRNISYRDRRHVFKRLSVSEIRLCSLARMMPI